MRLFVPPMDSIVVDVDADGRVCLDGEDYPHPTLQERRAIIYAARDEIAALTELVEMMERDSPRR